MGEKIHWKKLTNPDYLGAYSLGEKLEMDVTITDVKKEIIKGSDGKKQEKIILYLKDSKPMIANPTNCKTIGKIYDTNFVDDWIGKKITVFRTKIMAFGELTECLRVRPKAPKLPALTPAHPRWEGAREALIKKSIKMADLEKNYTISSANKKLLNEGV